MVLGRTYRFKLVASNEVGNVESANFAEIVAASVPLAPASPPTQDFAYTDADRIRVVLVNLTPGRDGGSAILGYDLWRDDGAGGDLVSLFGPLAESTSILALNYSDFSV